MVLEAATSLSCGVLHNREALVLNLPRSTYARSPFVSVTQSDEDCHIGWQQIGQLLASPAAVTVVELYPGCNTDEIESHLVSLLNPDLVLHSADALLTPSELEEQFRHILGNDPVFAYMQPRALEDFFCPSKLSNPRRQVQRNTRRILVIGTGASLIAPNPDRLIYADLARWEIQRRFRAHFAGNLGADNAYAAPSVLYKRAFFLDCRSADRLKANLLDRIDFLLDSNVENQPKLISGEHLRMGLRMAAQQPFRVVPFFDPGPWGGLRPASQGSHLDGIYSVEEVRAHYRGLESRFVHHRLRFTRQMTEIHTI
jgi:hypothetical protein